MSDFLTNLAARTVAAPSLRPRVSMRFEPSADSPLPMLDLAGPPAIPVDAVPVPAAVAQPAPARRPLDRTPVDGREPELHAARLALDAAAAAPPSLQPAAGVTRTAEPVRPNAERIASVAAVGRVGASAPSPGSPGASIGRVAPSAERMLPHRHDESPPSTSVVSATRRDDARPAGTPNIREPRVMRWALAPDGQVREKPQSRAAAPSAPRPEPVVHVSIGRIEVRATPAAAAARREPRGRGAMTIEEYMASRRERS